MAASDSVCIFADVKPGLSVLQVVIGVPEPQRQSALCVGVSSNSVEISECSCSCGEVNDNRICSFDFAESFNIAPQTCHGLQVLSPGNLHLRFRLQSDIGRPDIDLDLCRNASEKFSAKGIACTTQLSAEELRDVPFTGHCRMCGAKLLDGQNFARVLALPSENWLDGSESWWCHGGDHCHSDVSSTDKTHRCSTGDVSLSVKHQDCLVGESCLIVSEQALIGDSCLLRASRALRCRRCLNEVGRDLSSEWNKNKTSPRCSVGDEGDPLQRYVRLSLHALVLQRCYASLPVQWGCRPADLELTLASYFLEERSQSNHFRFVIETRDDKNRVLPVIVIWIMDTETTVFSGRHLLSASDVTHHQLKPVSVIKLLYKDCLRESNKSTGMAWYRDATVHNVELPEATCHQLLRQLINSTFSLPASLRSTGNGFYVGFMRKPS